MLLDSFAQWPGLTKFSRNPKLRIVIWIPAQKYFFFFLTLAREKIQTLIFSACKFSKKWRKMFTVTEASGGGPILVWYYMFYCGGLLKWRTQNLTLSSCSFGASIEFYQLAELLSFLSSIFFFFSSEHEIDLDFQTLIRIPNKTYMIVCFAFFSWEVPGVFF